MAASKLPNGLTHKQDKFARLVAQGWTQKAAYLEAYDADGMQLKTVDEKASLLMSQDKIRTSVVKYREPVIAILEKSKEKFAQTIVDTTEATDKDGRPDSANRLKAAKTGLDYLGYEPVQKNVNINVDMKRDEVENLLSNLD